MQGSKQPKRLCPYSVAGGREEGADVDGVPLRPLSLLQNAPRRRRRQGLALTLPPLKRVGFFRQSVDVTKHPNLLMTTGFSDYA